MSTDEIVSQTSADIRQQRWQARSLLGVDVSQEDTPAVLAYFHVYPFLKPGVAQVTEHGNSDLGRASYPPDVGRDPRVVGEAPIHLR